MRWSPTRLIAPTVIISLFIIPSFLYWKKNDIRNYLPQETHDYFHHDGIPKTQLPHVLEAFIQRPILTYDESVRLNAEACPTQGINFDEGNIRENEKNWRGISSTRISKWRHDIVAYLASKYEEEQEKINSGSSLVENGQGGRGIVMAAGDHDAAIRARTNIRLLRSYNCTLPIEIFHFPNELSAPDKSLLSDLSQPEASLTIRAVQGIGKGNGWKAFQIKGAAVQQSSFIEILYLDTDSYLLRNPEALFESEHWAETGLLLWPDYTKSHPTNPLWRLLGQQCRNEYEAESGQIFISRSRHQDVLWLVEYFALHHGTYYGFMGGDRDSFRAAALLLEKPWKGPGRLNAAAGVKLGDDPRGGGHTMLQADPEGRWMFVHANLIKHGQFPRPLWERIQRVAKDRYAGTSTYGSIDPPNEKLGEGVRLRVDQAPQMVSTMEVMEGYNKTLVVVEEWDAYEELKGFEEKWFGFGGVH
jgi:alpha 1,2-mannosyltransferase